MSQPPASPAFSVLIGTRDRPDFIGGAVASVLANTYPVFDLTVIDQSTTDATARALAATIAVDPRLHYVHLAQAGHSRAYNIGIDRTKGALLAFTDDDCIVPPHWLTSIAAAFASDAEADLLYGQVLPPSNQPVPGIIPMLRFTAPRRLSRRDGFKLFGMGANFAARRRLFEAIGGFDEVLGGGAPLRSAADFDLSYRTFRAGSAILLRPEVCVTHYGRRLPHVWPATLQTYGIGDGAFFLKHVRCRDHFAAWLLCRQLIRRGGRELTKRILHLGPTDLTYARSLFAGIRQSLQFDVDRDARLYVPRLVPRT